MKPDHLKRRIVLVLLPLLMFAAGCASEQILVSDTESIPGEPITELYLFADDRDLRQLYARNPRSDQRVEGFVRIGETGRIRTLRNGFRFRGNTSRYHPKKSFNIRFEHAQPFLFNSSRMNLNAMYTDPSGMREKLAWDMFHELGQPASKTRYFALYINGNYEGLGVHIQRVDEVLLSQNGLNPNGTMVRDLTRRNNRLLGLERQSMFGHDVGSEADVNGFLSQAFNSRWTSDWNALADFLQWVHDTPPGDEFYAGFTERVDTENFIDWLAIHYIIGDVDAYGDDYWLYKSPSSGSKWKFIPWDHDLSFGRNERDDVPDNRELGQYGDGLRQLSDFFAYEYPIDDGGWDNQLITSFLETPQLRDQLLHKIEHLITDVFTYDYFREKIDAHKSVISPLMELQPGDDRFILNERQHHGEQGLLHLHAENLLDYIELRYAYLDRLLNPVEGDLYRAEATIHSGSGGERILLTDSAGWTIAAFEPTDSDHRTTISVTVDELPENVSVDGIQREWTFTSSNGPVEGNLTLFYRNDIAPDGKENWYTGPVAIGNQWELAICDSDGKCRADSEVNPYSNKVVARVTLDSESRFQLRYRD